MNDDNNDNVNWDKENGKQSDGTQEKDGIISLVACGALDAPYQYGRLPAGWGWGKGVEG